MISVGSLFTGIGGIDLGLERAGFRIAWMCERDAYCQRVLAKHWPGVPIYDDATNLPDDVERVDVITAGFPCQPVSYAGRRNAQQDERWLWPYVEQCIRVLRPRGVLLENVPGLITAGFDDVIGGLAACGYDAEWDCIPAAAVGAPHLRDRVFIIATPCDAATKVANDGFDDPMADTTRQRPQGNRGEYQLGGGEPARQVARRCNVVADADGAPRSPKGSAGQAVLGPCEIERLGRRGGPLQESGRDGIWAAEPNVGRVANGVPHRVDRLRALGNAVVPQVAEHVGRQLARIMGVA